MPKTKLLIVRHGQSEWNIEHRWQGQADPNLSDLGREQSATAANKIGSVDVIISSPLMRAVETAQIISKSIGVDPVVIAAEFMERDAGDWSGMTRKEIFSQWPDWETSGYRPNGWEPDEDFLRRIFDGFDQVQEHYEGAEVLIVAHSGLIITLEKHFNKPQGRIANLGALEVTLGQGEPQLGERIEFLKGDLSTGGEPAEKEE